jgi:hypothetical protein
MMKTPIIISMIYPFGGGVGLTFEFFIIKLRRKLRFPVAAA